VVRRLRDSGNRTFFEIIITEGRNRQVRRMVEAVDSKVLKLVRTSIGPIEIGGLPIGKHRRLTAAEVGTLLRAAGAPAKTRHH
jgi:pseudouridine synthase